MPIKSMPTRMITNFLWVYSQGVPGISVVSDMCKSAGLKAPSDMDYRVSREWFTYPKSIKRLGKGIIVQDIKFKEKK